MNRMLVATAALVVFGCDPVAPPERPEPYRFAIDCRIEGLCASAAGNLQLIFHWPESSLPVRIWADPRRDLRLHVASAIRAWMDAGLYGEFRGVLVPDSQAADVIFLMADPVFTVRGDSSLAPGDCSATTTIDVGLDTTITLPFRSFVRPRAGASREELEACLPSVAAHELGHALGLFLHSDDPRDIMYLRATATFPSLRDRATFTTLYHTRPTVGVPTGR